MSLMDISDYDVDSIAGDLFKRIKEESKKLLRRQLSILGIPDGDVKLWHIKRILYPDDPNVLCRYEYDGKIILGVMIGESGMSIEFDVVNLETLKNKGEVQ
uniref:Uncharacterized protein n=1 Tax=viral metagenome TaxID=1070528 RepID=A0A6H1ZJM1_9ZZZZ